MYTCYLDGGISDGVKGSNRAVNANEEEEINSRFDGWLDSSDFIVIQAF